MATKTLTAKLANGQARCQGTSPSGRQCIQAVHTDATAHRYMDRDKEHKPLSAVLPSGFSLTATDVKPAEVLRKEITRKAAPRDQDQVKVDKDAIRNYTRNKASGNHTKTDKAKIHWSEYIVPPRAVDTVLDYLRRATSTGGPVKGTQLRYTRGAHASGNVRVQWAFTDKPPAGE